MRRLLAALPVLLAFGCSIVDPGDRDELRKRIASMPPSSVSTLTTIGMRAATFKFLHSKDDYDQVGKLQCRVQAGGKWSEWADQEPSNTVERMLDCLERNEIATYILCAQEFEFVETQLKNTDLKNSLPVPGGASLECRYVWDFRYDPEKVPPELTDPNAVELDDMIDAMIGLPAPPPGWAFPELVPLLCPLGAGPGWGCPPNPNDPTGGQPNDPSGGQSGDYP